MSLTATKQLGEALGIILAIVTLLVFVLKHTQGSA